MTRSLSQIAADTRGAALIEFALLAPVLAITLLGLFDMAYNYYLQAQLQGSIQAAARNSTLEGAVVRTAEIDARVTEAVNLVVPSAELDFTRYSYTNFTEVSQPEDFVDLDHDGRCNDGEPFEDANGNGTWDEDRGKQGGGGARDAVLYTVTVRYPRAFGAARIIGLPAIVETEASTILRNQPFGKQDTTAGVGNCA